MFEAAYCQGQHRKSNGILARQGREDLCGSFSTRSPTCACVHTHTPAPTFAHAHVSIPAEQLPRGDLSMQPPLNRQGSSRDQLGITKVFSTPHVEKTSMALFPWHHRVLHRLSASSLHCSAPSQGTYLALTYSETVPQAPRSFLYASYS